MFKLSGAAGTRLYTFDLAPGTHRVGRVQEVPVCIPDATVSRSHAEFEITPSGDQCFLTDLGSHNGTRVNGTRLGDKRELHVGDVIQFGKTEFTLEGDGPHAAAPRTQVRTIISPAGPSTSVLLPIREALSNLPRKVTELPEFVPTVSELARLLVGTEAQEAMLEKSLALVSKVVPSDRLLVIFMDGDQARVGASLLSSARHEGEITLSKTIVHEIMANKNSVLISDAGSDPRFLKQESIVQSAMKSAMAVPLFDEGKVLGILYADTQNLRVRYDHDLLRVLATFGHIIASRLANYSLVLERQAKRELEAELENAAAIQKSLLASKFPSVPGYALQTYQEQSRAVGGDLYDVSCLADGRLFVLVADVSGKGMGAALLMSNILASFRVLYGEANFDLASAVERVSLQLFKYSAPGQFATLFGAVLDPDSGRMQYVNAGHNQPILMKPDGQMERLEPTGLMVGAFDFAAWEEGACEMCKGDTLLVFSDGVTEANNPALEEFGEDRLRSVLLANRETSVESLVSRLRDEIRVFAAGAPASDDITLLALKRSA